MARRLPTGGSGPKILTLGQMMSTSGSSTSKALPQIGLGEAAQYDDQQRASRFRFPTTADALPRAEASCDLPYRISARRAHSTGGVSFRAGKPVCVGPPSRAICSSTFHIPARPLALVRGCQIGGDVERIPTDLEAEAERFLSAAEKELLSAVPQQHKYAAFFHASTAKKPYSRPRRRAAPLSDFDVPVAPGEPAALLATRRSWWGRPLASAKHWELRRAAALAVDKTPSQPFQRTIPPSEIPVGGFHPARGRAVVTVVIAAASWSVTGRSPSRNTRCHISRVSRRQMRWP